MTSPSKIEISVIIPAKDEENRLPVFLSSLISHCQTSLYKYEIIVVDDGSRDKTSDAVKLFQSKFSRLRLITLRENRGKGFAVKAGVWEAKGKAVLFMDADGSTPVDAIEENLHFLSQGYDIVVGSRVLKDTSHSVKVKNYRKFIGQVFNFFVHRFLINTVQDTQCGFKMFKASVIRPLFSRLNINGFGFDLEILYLTNKFGFKLKEVPVNWHHVDASKTNLLVDSIKMFINIFQIRNWHLINCKNEAVHMSEEEITRMFAVEKNHWWFQSKNGFVTHLLEKEQGGPKMILDAGCGTGMNLMFLEKFGRCYGCDAVQTALKFCLKNNLKKLVCCDLEHMPFQPKKFDLITVLDVIEHVAAPSTVLSQLKTLLKDDGKVIITVPAFKILWGQHDEALSHFRRYSKKEFRCILDDAGFEIQSLGYYFCFPFILAAPIRIIRRIMKSASRYESDTVKIPPAALNGFLKWLLKVELKISDKIPLPFGTTLYAVVKNSAKPPNAILDFQNVQRSLAPKDDQVLINH